MIDLLTHPFIGYVSGKKIHKDKRDCEKCNTRMEYISLLAEDQELWQCPKCKTVKTMYGG